MTACDPRPAIGLIAAGMLALAPAGPTHARMACDPCVFGTVFDGPWERNEQARAAFEGEIADLVAPEFEVVFPDDKHRIADWTVDGVRAELDALLADPQVDLLLTLGPVGSTLAARRAADLPKPVVAAFTVNPRAQGFPSETTADGERVSGAPRFSYVDLSGNPAEELRRFRELAPFDRLAFLANATLIEAAPQLEANLASAARPLGVDLTVVPVGASVAAALEEMPAGTEAVYVAPLNHLPSPDFDLLVRGLSERGLPTFSFRGRSDVDRGLLMSLYVDADFRRLGRRLALNAQRILGGEEAGAISVDFRRSQRLTINMATARAIGVFPGWSVFTEAELLHDEPAGGARHVSLATAVREAVAANLDLAAADRSLAAGRQEVRAARAALLPQVHATSLAEMIDRDRSVFTLGILPRWLSAASIGVSQVLYSDRARAAAEIEGDRLAGRRESLDDLRLGIAHAAGVGYVDVLRAKAFERIDRDNLTVTRSNLELAQARQRAGAARASEVVRWEHEVADNRRALLEATARRRVAEVALNRVLHRPLEEPFTTADVDLNDPAMLATAATIDGYAGDRGAFDRFRDFVAEEGLASSPALKRIDADIRAQERAVLAARRALWAPEVAATGNLMTQKESRSDALGFDRTSFLPPKNALDWRAGVVASLPLFEGGARRAERARNEHVLDEMRLIRRAAAERVEQEIRSAVFMAGASYNGIDLAAQAAVAAQRNLALVTDTYEQGVVSILDLLDAQHVALVAEQAEANAVYDYLSDVLDVQRAIGRIGFLMTPGDLAAFAGRLQRFFAAAAEGGPGPPPTAPQ